MLVSSTNGPLRYRVKVIDFGSACHSSKAVQNTYLQSRYYRAPEILLGLPFNEAIDIWSLGCVIAKLFLGWPLYPGSSEYDQMRYIVETQGLPPPDLLQNAGKRNTFFVRDPYHCDWRLKTQEEYALETGQQAKEARKYFFTSLSQICDVSGLLPSDDFDSELEQEDRQQFASLLSLMLKMRPTERVLPDNALFHPFITMVHLQTCPFSKSFHESIALMQVCHKATRRRQLLNSRNASDQFSSLPSLNDPCPSVATSVLPSPTDPDTSFVAPDPRNPDIQQPSSAVAYYAAAAVAALAKPNPQVVACIDPKRTTNCLPEQYAMSSLSTDESQQPSISLLSDSSHTCSLSNQHPTATVLLTQNKPEVDSHPNADTVGLLNSCVTVPQSLSLYDLVAAGGTALSLLNAVTAPASSTAAVAHTHLRNSTHTSYDCIPHQVQQHQQLPVKYCKLDSTHLHLDQAERAALMLSSYLGQEQVQLAPCEPYVSVPSFASGVRPCRIEAADIRNTLNAFVQQHQLCQTPAALTVLRQHSQQRQGLVNRHHKSFVGSSHPSNLCSVHPTDSLRSTGVVLPSASTNGLLSYVQPHSQHHTSVSQSGQNRVANLQRMSSSKLEPRNQIVYDHQLQHSAVLVNPSIPVLNTAHASSRDSFHVHPALIHQQPHHSSAQLSIQTCMQLSRTPSPTSVSIEMSSTAAGASEALLPMNLATTSNSDVVNTTFGCPAQKLASSDSLSCAPPHTDWVRYHSCSTSGVKSFDHQVQAVLKSRSTADFSISTTTHCPPNPASHLNKTSECQLLSHSVSTSLTDVKYSPPVSCSTITTVDSDTLSAGGMDRPDPAGQATCRGSFNESLPGGILSSIR
ncbi:unnamed protein product [Dicrocoelium dendriticum]|nr:unnamed protein product [Dicrocoelium dendriticum]